MTIDQEKRRNDIARITNDVIAAEGLDAATIRHIASVAGFSTTAITHYFSDKQELLLWSFQCLAQEGKDRFAEAIAACPDDIVPALMTHIPWCPPNIRRWRAYLAYWDHAARDPEFASLLREATQVGLDSIRRLIELSGGQAVDVERATRHLNALMQGLSLQAIVDPEYWTENRLRTTLIEMWEMVLSERIDSTA